MITVLKNNNRQYITCSCGIKNQIVSSIYGRCPSCRVDLKFSNSFIQKGSCRTGVMAYYKFGFYDYDSVDQNKATKLIYNKLLKNNLLQFIFSADLIITRNLE